MEKFESYLKDVHAENFAERILDDDMPDHFDGWVTELDVEEVMGYAEQFGQIMYKKGVASAEEELSPAELDPRMK